MIVVIITIIFLNIVESKIVGLYQVCRHGSRTPLQAFS